MKRQDLFSLKDKVAIVTGGTGYLGSAICDCLARYGARVVIAGRDMDRCNKKAAELRRLYGSRPVGVEMDISSHTSVAKAMALVNGKAGGIDILVNNAFFGMGGNFKGDIRSISDEMWKRGMDGTANGVFRCVKEVVRYMEKRGKGSIINISSIYGVVSPDPNIYEDSGFNNPPVYGAGKAAIIQFTKIAACDLAQKNIRVNSISPGAFPGKDVQKNKKFVSNLNKKIPLGRIGRPEDLKGAVLFLASDASSYVTGSNVLVDGGWTAW